MEQTGLVGGFDRAPRVPRRTVVVEDQHHRRQRPRFEPRLGQFVQPSGEHVGDRAAVRPTRYDENAVPSPHVTIVAPRHVAPGVGQRTCDARDETDAVARRDLDAVVAVDAFDRDAHVVPARRGLAQRRVSHEVGRRLYERVLARRRAGSAPVPRRRSWPRTLPPCGARPRWLPPAPSAPDGRWHRGPVVSASNRSRSHSSPTNVARVSTHKRARLLRAPEVHRELKDRFLAEPSTRRAAAGEQARVVHEPGDRLLDGRAEVEPLHRAPRDDHRFDGNVVARVEHERGDHQRVRRRGTAGRRAALRARRSRGRSGARQGDRDRSRRGSACASASSSSGSARCSTPDAVSSRHDRAPPSESRRQNSARACSSHGRGPVGNASSHSSSPSLGACVSARRAAAERDRERL